jgi:hypothetical protein
MDKNEGINFICLLNSGFYVFLPQIPTPNKATNQCGEEAVHMVNRAIPDYLEQRTVQKLLLVGSGASTILKQVQCLWTSNKLMCTDV